MEPNCKSDSCRIAQLEAEVAKLQHPQPPLDVPEQAMEDIRQYIRDLRSRLHKWESPLGVSELPEPNPIDAISASCGWVSLTPGKTMTVHYGGSEYEITRQRRIRFDER